MVVGVSGVSSWLFEVFSVEYKAMKVPVDISNTIEIIERLIVALFIVCIAHLIGEDGIEEGAVCLGCREIEVWW